MPWNDTLQYKYEDLASLIFYTQHVDASIGEYNFLNDEYIEVYIQLVFVKNH